MTGAGEQVGPERLILASTRVSPSFALQLKDAGPPTH